MRSPGLVSTNTVELAGNVVVMADPGISNLKMFKRKGKKK